MKITSAISPLNGLPSAIPAIKDVEGAYTEKAVSLDQDKRRSDTQKDENQQQERPQRNPSYTAHGVKVEGDIEVIVEEVKKPVDVLA